MDKLLLNGKWKFRGADLCGIGSVPGDIAGDLFDAGMISDPYYGDNHKDLKWVHESDWVYSREFQLGEEFECPTLQLCLDGVDTFSDVYINGNLILQTDNMHLGYTADIKPYAIKGINTVEIKLKSTLKVLEALKNDKYLCIFNNERILIRKAQCHFGWDWAPDFPGYGVYRDVYILFGGTQGIDTFRVDAHTDGNVQFRVELKEKLAAGAKVKIKIFAGNNANEGEYYIVQSGVYAKRHVLNVKINKPSLWWPNGYGEQNLYSYIIEIEKNGKIIDKAEGKIGLRSVELCQKPVDGNNNDFAFIVNGRRVFCKGSNWVPADCMTGRIAPGRYRDLLLLAKGAGFNMLRVWGGGIYESNEFYDFCDELGIMVWQEFMFACSDVPDDEEHLVKAYVREAEYQIKRLRNHICITYWCGVNEKPGAFQDYDLKYGRFYLNYILRGLCAHFSPLIPYGICSPVSDNDIDNDFSGGDVHTNITKHAMNSDKLKTFWEDLDKTKNNFSSECAVIGCCRYKSLAKFIPLDRMDVNDVIFTERFMGNPYENCDAMQTFISMEAKIAADLFGKITDFKDFVKKSALSQSDILEAEIKYARTNGRCNGILNWMYNDIWPIGTWAVVDYYLTPKPAYFAMKRAFSPVLAAIVRDASGAFVKLVNNGIEPIHGKLTYGCVSYDGSCKKEKILETVKLGKDEIFSIPVFATEGAPVIYCRYNAGGAEYSDILDTQKYDGYKPAGVKVEKIEAETDGVLLTLRAEQFCRCVVIDSGNGDERLSDNFFDMLPGGVKLVKLVSKLPVDRKKLAVRTFGDRWDV